MYFRKEHFRDWCLAAVTTIGVIAALGGLFRYQASPRSAGRDHSGIEVVLTTPRGLGSIRWVEFSRFLSWHDPMLSLREGFAPDRDRQHRIAPIFTPDTLTYPSPRWRSDPLPPLVKRKKTSPAMPLAPDWRRAANIPPERVRLFLGARQLAIPVGLFTDIPAGNVGNVVTVIGVGSAYPLPESETGDSAMVPVPLFRVVSSCGNVERDTYAMRELSRMILPAGSEEILIVWPNAAGRK